MDRRQTSRRADTRPVAERQVAMLECHSDLPVDRDVNGATREAEVAASRKEAKNADIDERYVFEPIAVETLGVFNSSALILHNDLGRRISEISGKVRETNFFQRLCATLYSSGTQRI